MGIDPLHVCGNAVNLEYRTIRFLYRSDNFFCFVLQIGCIPSDVQGGYRLQASPRALRFRVLYTINGGKMGTARSVLWV